MFKFKDQAFKVVIASLIIAAPVLAADDSTTNGAAPSQGRMVAAKNLGCSGGGSFHRGGKMGFSDSQLEKMASEKDQFLNKTASERSQLGILHRQLREELSQTNIDRSKAESILAKINSIKADLSTAKLDLKINEIALLTPDQREQMRHRMLVAEAFGGGFGHHRHVGGRHFEHGGEHGSAHQDRA
jgi:Spy/CpxP family protein refolding chaperone